MKPRGIKRTTLRGVAPHAGAWIETFLRETSADLAVSPPTRGRGLKRGGDLLPLNRTVQAAHLRSYSAGLA